MASSSSQPPSGSQKTWGGRFSTGTDRRVEAFTESIQVDRRLYSQDITASQAHARMLAEVGLLTTAEADQLVAALEQIRAEFAAGTFPCRSEWEDIHTHIEQALIARLGDLGRKLHTGRSRNDQIATDLKLWLRDAIGDVDRRLHDLQRAFLAAAERDRDLILPGYTHLQRAQPVLAAHYFLAYMEKFDRDRARLADCFQRSDELPLGAAALAGTSLPIDRESVRKKLGFSRLANNSIDVVSDRDFLIEFAFCLSMIAVHLSGWSEEWIVWSTVEFGFLDLPEAFCTGSSIMPHKKNPDVLELIRGKSAQVIGQLQSLLVLVKGLPLAYNRDLQEDKRSIFQAYDAVVACLEVAVPLVQEARLRRDVIQARLDEGFLDATTLMEALIADGMPMRSAHEAVGHLVRECESRGCRLADLPVELFDRVRPGRGSALIAVLGVTRAVGAFRSAGSTAPAEVAKHLDRWRQRLEDSGKLRLQ